MLTTHLSAPLHWNDIQNFLRVTGTIYSTSVEPFIPQYETVEIAACADVHMNNAF